MSWIPFPLDSNRLCVFRNKYAEVELMILDEILVVSKIVFYQMPCFLLDIFNLPNLPFAEPLLRETEVIQAWSDICYLK